MKRTILIGCAVGAVVVVLIWYFLLFSPTSSDLNDTRDEVASAKSKNQELENEVRQLKELSRNSVEQQAKLRTLRAAIPATPDLGEFILQANDIASAAGIDWLSIAPARPIATTGGGPNGTIAISMQVQGQFSAVIDYLNRLEDLERLVVIDTINVSTGGGAGDAASTATSVTGAPDLSVSISGRMFTDAAPAAAPGSTGGSTTTPGASAPTTVPSTTPPASSSGSSS